MKHFQVFLLLFAMLGGSSCVTSKTFKNEKTMEEWLSTASLPITVQFQSNEMRCKPSLYCYTLIDNTGKIHYAQNVRYRLPPVIPPSPDSVQPRWWERVLGGG